MCSSQIWKISQELFNRLTPQSNRLKCSWFSFEHIKNVFNRLNQRSNRLNQKGHFEIKTCNRLNEQVIDYYREPWFFKFNCVID